MASLTETAYYSRMIIKVGGILLVTLIVGRVLIAYAYKLYLILNPPEAAAPTMGFGKLPPIEFPEKEARELTYQLETPTGKLMPLPLKAKVYKVVQERPNLLALERATEEVKKIGFVNAPEQVSEILFRWRRSNPITTTLDMKIFWGTFEMKVDWATRTEFLTEKQLPTEVKAVTDVKALLTQATWLNEDLELGEHKISFLKAFGQELKPTISLSEADFVQVDLYRALLKNKEDQEKEGGKEEKEEFETVTANPDQGVVRGIVSGNPRLERIINLEYNYFPLDYDRIETYPIIDPADAWQQLTQGQGYIASLDPGITRATVRRMYLAYFDAYDSQPYLQPVVVFTGDNNLIAYVPAALNEIPENRE